ncbi:MAG: hypothetical protein O3A13_03220 [Proteobacteria bacterium]|nr:hypothetical protein [Pseudomonadota bacterium]MDA0992626.1 hypothetical protein [Pseudomonadota bacterium]
MRSAIRFFVAVIVLALVTGTAAEKPIDDDLASETLELAEQVGLWIANSSVRTAEGTVWPDDALNPEVVSYDLASGVAGKVLFFIALYRATENPDYLELALGGADYLVTTLNDPGVFEGNQRRASLYSGISGIGVALAHVQPYARQEKYEVAIEKVSSLLSEWGIVDERGLHWSDEFNDLLFGDAGTILYLSWHAERTRDVRALALAHRGAQFLLSEAADAAVGKFWYFRRSKLFNLPNFSHGTAGVAYVLATVGAQVSDESLRLGAQAGFDYIRSIAEIEDDILRIPYGWGSDAWDGLYEFGWAHGLTGTISFFVRLQQTGIDAESASEYERMSRHTLQNIGLPNTPARPFAEPATSLDVRFGRAGVLSLASDWSVDDSASDEGTALRNDLWSHIARAAIRDERTAHWEIDAPEFMGGERAAYTGIFHGAAGMGLAILRMHARISGVRPYVDMPDNPIE